MDDIQSTFIKSLVGGILIGLGGTCFLSVDNRVLGAFLFSLGLLAICVTEQLLFTGKCSYCGYSLKDAGYLLVILFGNFIGSIGIGTIIGLVKPELADKALSMCEIKLLEGDNIVPLGVLCNVLIYFAIEGYKKGQSILLIMCVMAFILCGFEHCIANMYYFAVAGKMLNPSSWVYLVSNVICNWSGGIIVFALRTILDK